MNRNWLNFAVDTITALLALAMVLTGMLMRWVLAAGSGRRGLLWGLSRHQWGDVHWWLSLALVGVALLHIALHWQWICSMMLRICRGSGVIQSRLASRAAGVVVAVALGLLLWGFVVLARSSVTVPVGGATPPGRVQPIQVDIRGSTTLGQAAEMLNIDVATLCERLDLDPSTRPDINLGVLARNKGMTMSDLRRLAEQR